MRIFCFHQMKMKMKMKLHLVITPFTFLLLYSTNHQAKSLAPTYYDHSSSSSSFSSSSSSSSSSICGPSTCGSITVKYPFGALDGCGASQFRNMLNCSFSTAADLLFITPSGTYKVQSINYVTQLMTIYDPRMSTCSLLQPHRDFIMTEVQYAIIPPSPDTIFILLNCSFDSPIFHHYTSLCFNISPDTCSKLYSTCNAFTPFNLNPNTTTTTTPSCCFTGYSTLKYMSMNMLDCSHYTTVYGTTDDDLRGVTPLDWKYGISLSYSVADTGCEACHKSGGECGFDTETEGGLCLCSDSLNSTRQCAIMEEGGGASSTTMFTLFQAFALLLIFIHVY